MLLLGIAAATGGGAVVLSIELVVGSDSNDYGHRGSAVLWRVGSDLAGRTQRVDDGGQRLYFSGHERMLRLAEWRQGKREKERERERERRRGEGGKSGSEESK